MSSDRKIANSEDHEYSNDNSTLKSSGKQETNTSKNSVSFNEDSIEINEQGAEEKLTGKQKQYLKDQIYDQNGAYSFLENPDEYKKARKRLQNRESAVRSRQRNKCYQGELEGLIEEQNGVILQLNEEKKKLKESNAALSSENTILKQQLQYFQETFANSGVIEGDQNQLQSVAPAQDLKPANDVVRQEDLNRLELEILNKVQDSINQRLNQNQMSERPQIQLQKSDSDHIIRRSDQYCQYDDILEDRKRNRDPLESMMSEEFCDYPQIKRQRTREDSLDVCSDFDTSEQFTLQRNDSLFQNKGFLFLAAVTCIVCVSSVGTTNDSGFGGEQAFVNIINTGKKPLSHIMNHLNQMDQDQNLNLSDVGDHQLTDEEIEKLQQHKTQDTLSESTTNLLLKQISPSMQVYAYLAYFVFSTIGFITFVYSFFAWLVPGVFEEPQNEKQQRVHTRHSRKSRKDHRGQRKHIPEKEEPILDI